MIGGVEYNEASFRQVLTNCLVSPTNDYVFGDVAGGPVAPFLLASPFFLGGRVAEIAAQFRQYSFEELNLEYVPGASTTEPNSLAIAYDPDPNKILSTSSDSYGSNAWFTSALQLASCAAGPVWGPLIASGLNIGKKLLGTDAGKSIAGKFMSWLQTRKPTMDNAVTQFLFDLAEFRDSHRYELELRAELDALYAANSFTMTGVTEAVPPTTSHSGDDGSDETQARLAQAIGGARTSYYSEILATSQGKFLAATSAPASGDQRSTGVFVVSGRIRFSDPNLYTGGVSGDTAFAVRSYGDPLDVSDPEHAPHHLNKGNVERQQYMDPTWGTVVVDPLLQEVLRSVGILPHHRVIDLTRFEMDVSRRKTLRLMASRYNNLRSSIEGKFEILEPEQKSSSKPEQSRATNFAVALPRESRAVGPEWVRVDPPRSSPQVGRALALMEAMRSGVANAN